MVEKNNNGLRMIHTILAIIVILGTGIVWLANTHFVATANEEDIAVSHEVQNELVKDVAQIQVDVSYLKAGQQEIKQLIKDIR